MVLSGASSLRADDPVVKLLKPADYQKKLEQAKTKSLIDVRTEPETKLGIIQGATNITFGEDDFEKKLEKLPRDQPLFLYCGGGFRSGESVKIAKKLGFEEIFDLQGGLTEWKKAELPIVEPQE